MSILLAFLSALSWGAADYLGGVHAKRLDMLVLTICREIGGIALFLVFIAFTGGHPQTSDLAIGLGCGVMVGIALPVFFSTLASGRMALVAPVAGSVGAVLPILIGLISNERPSLPQLFGLGLAVAAVAFVSVEHREVDGCTRRHVNVVDIVKALSCGVAFGFFFVGMHHTSEESGLWPGLFVCLGVLLTLFTWVGMRNPANFRQITPSTIRMVGVGGALDAVAATCFLYATRGNLLSITAGVASLYPVGTALLATFLLKEHLSRINAAGLVMCGAGLAFIAA